jgi:hypothetical protein
MRLFVVVAARTAEEEQNFLRVFSHIRTRYCFSPTTTTKWLGGSDGSPIAKKTELPTPSGPPRPLPSAAQSAPAEVSGRSGFAEVGILRNKSTPPVPPYLISAGTSCGKLGSPPVSGIGFRPKTVQPVPCFVDSRHARICVANEYASASSRLYQTSTCPFGFSFKAPWNPSQYRNRAPALFWANTSRCCSSTIVVSSIVCRCSEKPNSARVDSCSPTTPIIASVISSLRRAFHFSDSANSSDSQAQTNSTPKPKAAPTDIYHQMTVVDLDNDKSVPINPYALALVIFLALQIVLVGAVLIRRTWKSGGKGNSN